MTTFQQASDLAHALNALLEHVSLEERIEIMETVMDGYCKWCGGVGTPCFCWNDE